MKKFLNLWTYCILCIFYLSSLFSTEKKVIVGTAGGYAPYVSLNTKGEYEGFDVDVARLLAEKLDCHLVLKDLGSMPSLMIALQQEKVDLLIWAVSITEERRKAIEQIHYQGDPETQIPLLFWKEAPKGLVSLEDLAQNGKGPLCVEAGSWQEEIAQEYPSLSLKFVTHVTDAILELKYKKSWSAAVDPSLIPRLMAQYPELKVFYVQIPASKQSWGNGICVAKSNRALAEKVRQAILELKQAGKIAELEKKWNLANPGAS